MNLNMREDQSQFDVLGLLTNALGSIQAVFHTVCRQDLVLSTRQLKELSPVVQKESLFPSKDHQDLGGSVQGIWSGYTF